MPAKEVHGPVLEVLERLHFVYFELECAVVDFADDLPDVFEKPAGLCLEMQPACFAAADRVSFFAAFFSDHLGLLGENLVAEPNNFVRLLLREAGTDGVILLYVVHGGVF